jgi:DNA-binding MarR family transcriptional regulator
MSTDLNVGEIASSLQVAFSLLMRRMRQAQESGDLTVPQVSALARIDREGPNTVTALAKAEQISPQSMGATLNALEARGLIERSADPTDGRRVVLSISPAGHCMLRGRQNARARQLKKAFSAEFTSSELSQLMAAVLLLERVATEM